MHVQLADVCSVGVPLTFGLRFAEPSHMIYETQLWALDVRGAFSMGPACLEANLLRGGEFCVGNACLQTQLAAWRRVLCGKFRFTNSTGAYSLSTNLIAQGKPFFRHEP